MSIMAHFRIGEHYFLHRLNTTTDEVECVEYFNDAAIEPLVVFTATGDVLVSGKHAGQMRLDLAGTWSFYDAAGMSVEFSSDLYRAEADVSVMLLRERYA